MTAEEKYSENFNIGRRGGSNRVIDEFNAKDENSEEQKAIDTSKHQSPGMVFSSRNQGVAGLGLMSDYANTGIYVDPNQIIKKNKAKKKIPGRDIKYAIKDLEAASFMDMDDFMSGSLPIGKKATSKLIPNEDNIEDQVN